MESSIMKKDTIEFQKNHKQKQILSMIDYLSEEAYLIDISLRKENYETFFGLLYEVIKNMGFEKDYSKIVRSYICDTVSEFGNLDTIGVQELIQNLDSLKFEENPNKSKIKVKSSN